MASADWVVVTLARVYATIWGWFSSELVKSTLRVYRAVGVKRQTDDSRRWCYSAGRWWSQWEDRWLLSLGVEASCLRGVEQSTWRWTHGEGQWVGPRAAGSDVTASDPGGASYAGGRGLWWLMAVVHSPFCVVVWCDVPWVLRVDFVFLSIIPLLYTYEDIWV